MPGERFKMVVATHIFLVQDNRILLARRFNTGYEDGKFSVPAGHIDGNESVTEATIREVKEEIGIAIQPNHLRFIEVINRRANRESIDFFFVCKKWSGEAHIAELDKCDLLQWTNIHKLPANTVMYVRSAIEGYIKNAPFLELDY